MGAKALEMETFTVPEGVHVEPTEQGMEVVYAGGIVLRGHLGSQLATVRSTDGDIVLSTSSRIANVEAPNGSVRVETGIQAARITAERVELTGAAQVDAVEAGAGGLEFHDVATVGDIQAHGGAVFHSRVEADTVRVTGPAAIFHGDTTAGTIEVDGDAIFHGDVRADRIDAHGGEVVLAGTAMIGSVTGARVRIEGPETQVKTVRADQSIEVGTGRIRADVLMAPEVLLDPATRGKISVVESHNELGPHRVKGCLRLADLDDLFGNANEFLAQRGLEPLGDPLGDHPQPDDDRQDDDDRVESETTLDAVTTDERATGPEAVQVGQRFDLDSEEAVESAEAAANGGANDTEEPHVNGQDDSLYQRLKDSLQRIDDCYHDPLPPPVEHLHHLVENRDYNGILNGLNGIFNELVRFHRHRGTQIHPRVAPTFTIIHNLLSQR